jgi:hypothetical protein
MKYSEENIIDLIKKVTNPQFGGLMIRVKKDTALQEVILQSTIFLDGHGYDISFRAKAIRLGLSEPPTCKHCQKILRVFKKFCSPVCNSRYYYSNTQTEENRKEKAKKNSRSYWEKTEEEKNAIKGRREKTNLSRYGVKHNFLIPGSRERIEEKNLEKWGFKNPCQSEEIRQKIKETNFQKYGSNSPSANPEVRKKINETLLEKYGTLYAPFSTYKSYKFPSGRVHYYLGYEDRAFDILLEYLNESDFIFDQKELFAVLPPIEYINEKGQISRYFPDIYLPEQNKIIEVKSQWTYDVSESINLKKKESCLSQGFCFEFWIFERYSKSPIIK